MGAAYLALLGALTWVVWRVFRRYAVRSPLDNVPGPQASSWLKGNFGAIFYRHGWEFHDRLREQYGAVSAVYGLFGTRALYVFDPKALNSVILKDQMVYEEPAWFVNWNDLWFGPGLFATIGEHHRKQRKMLNPVFSIAHMRRMTPLFYEMVHRLRRAVNTELGDAEAEINMLEWMARTALELIGQGGLGYSFDPLTANTTNDFVTALKDFSPALITMQEWRLLSPYAARYIPASIRPILARIVPSRKYQNFRRIIWMLDSHARALLYSKRAALEKGDEAVVHQVGEGKDILSILMKANMAASEEDRLSEEELVAQITGLVFAATDTTSNALARILQLLSENQDAQDKVRAELLDAAPADEDIPYDQLVELPYLDAVCRETMRLHPPVNHLGRETREDIVMPLSEPLHGVDGTLMTEIPVPKDTTVIVSIRGCNRNKALWGDDAHEWRPERWLQPLPASVTGARVPGVYANLMTFLGGGRSCIGFKFSQLEMKVVLAVMLRSFRFTPSDKEVYWNLGGVNYPTIGKVSNKPELPIKVQAIA